MHSVLRAHITRQKWINHSCICVQVNTNGVLSFGSEFPDYTPIPFSTVPFAVLAPFWNDVNTNRFGSIYYRQSTSGSELSKLQEIVTTTFNTTGFEIRELVVATYHQVAQFAGRDNEVSHH